MLTMCRTSASYLLCLFLFLYFQLKQKITAAAVAPETGDDDASSIASTQDMQDMQQRHDEDIVDINLLLDGQQDPATPKTTEQAPPSFTGGKKKTHMQKMKEQDAAFLTHMKERADATAQFRAEIMAAAVASPKKSDSARSGFCHWFESVAESLHPSLWPR